MGKKNKRRQRNTAGAGSSGSAGTTKFTAPTSGLEDMYFTLGTAKNAAKFEDTVSKLARHVGTLPWPQSLVAPKAISTLQTPEFVEPMIPTQEYLADPGRTVKTNDKTRPETGNEVVDNPPVKEDWEHNLKVKEYKLVTPPLSITAFVCDIVKKCLTTDKKVLDVSERTK